MLTHSLIRTTHQTKSVRAVNRNRCHGAGNGTNTHTEEKKEATKQQPNTESQEENIRNSRRRALKHGHNNNQIFHHSTI